MKTIDWPFEFTGTYWIDNRDSAISFATRMKTAGLRNVFRLVDYGLHIYFNIPALVK